MGAKTEAKESYRNVIHFDERTCTKDALTTLYQALRPSSLNISLIFHFVEINPSRGINIVLKTPSLHGKHTECGAKDWSLKKISFTWTVCLENSLSDAKK